MIIYMARGRFKESSTEYNVMVNELNGKGNSCSLPNGSLSAGMMIVLAPPTAFCC